MRRTRRSDATRDTSRAFASLRRPRAGERARVAVVSDVHYAPTESGTSKQLHRSVPHFDSFVRDAASRDLDAVVCLGDVAHRGRPAAFEAVAEALADLDAPVLGVPGNHDLAATASHGGVSEAAFARAFAGPTPYARSVGPLTVVGVSTPGGDVDVAALAETLAGVDGPAILCTHEPLPETVAALSARAAGPGIVESPSRNARLVAEALDEAVVDVPLTLSGHVHVPLLTRTSDRTEIAAPPLCTYPQGYLLLSVSAVGCRVSFVPVASAATLAETRRARAAAGATASELTVVARETMAALPFREPAVSTRTK